MTCVQQCQQIDTFSIGIDCECFDAVLTHDRLLGLGLVTPQDSRAYLDLDNEFIIIRSR